MEMYKQDTTITQAVRDQAIQEALGKGLRRVDANGRYKSEKLTLSLVHQANVALILPPDEAAKEFTMYVK